MTRKKWIQDPNTGKLVPAELYRKPRPDLPYVYGDLKEYMPVAGDQAYTKPVDGRKQHREFLRRNNLQEAGDMKKKDFMQYGGKTKENYEDRQRRLKKAGDYIKHTKPRWMDFDGGS